LYLTRHPSCPKDLTTAKIDSGVDEHSGGERGRIRT
jgi:hypothetical protein